jgi:hypothetical protein
MYVRQLSGEFRRAIYSGRRAGGKLSRRVPGAHCDDLLNLPDNWMKNISGERLLFGYFILSCRPYLQDKYGTALAGPKGELHGCNS